jgi:hypothetical protein
VGDEAGGSGTGATASDTGGAPAFASTDAMQVDGALPPHGTPAAAVEDDAATVAVPPRLELPVPPSAADTRALPSPSCAIGAASQRAAADGAAPLGPPLQLPPLAPPPAAALAGDAPVARALLSLGAAAAATATVPADVVVAVAAAALEASDAAACAAACVAVDASASQEEIELPHDRCARTERTQHACCGRGALCAAVNTAADATSGWVSCRSIDGAAMDCDAPACDGDTTRTRSVRAPSAPRTTGSRRPRRVSAALGGSGGRSVAGAVCTAPEAATPTAAEGAEALTALMAHSRASGLPPMRLVFPPNGGAAGEEEGEEEGEQEADEGGGGLTAAPGTTPAAARAAAAAGVYVRKEHSLRTLCQVRAGEHAVAYMPPSPTLRSQLVFRFPAASAAHVFRALRDFEPTPLIRSRPCSLACRSASSRCTPTATRPSQSRAPRRS